MRFVERIAEWSIPHILSRVASPVILKVSPQHIPGILEELRPYSFRVYKRILDVLTSPEITIFPSEPMLIQRFNMIAMFLPREVIFDFAEDVRVEKIFLDSIKFALQYPTVPQEGVFKIKRKGKDFYFTSTKWTKMIIGGYDANAKGFTGKGIKVAVLDTGASILHEMLRGRVKTDSAFLFQRLDSNGHGCVLPNTTIALTNPGLVTIKELYDSIDVEPIETNAGLTKIPKKDIYTYSVSNEGKIVKGKILAVHKLMYKGELIKIRTITGKEIKLTPWHPVMIVKPDPNHGYSKPKYVYKRADKVKKGDKVVLFGSQLDFDKDVLAFLVTSIEKEYYNGEMYDLTVEGYNNYYADGFVAHNTWCAACIGGRKAVDDVLSRIANAYIECDGIAPECELYSIKVLGYIIGAGSDSTILKGLEMAMNFGADVISMSLGGKEEATKEEDDPYYHAFNEIVAKGVIPVVAAGNDGKSNSINTPGALTSVLTVGATDPITGEVAPYSSRGPTNWDSIKPDVVAPGGGYPDNAIDNAIVNLLDTAGDGIENRYSPIQGTCLPSDIDLGGITMKEISLGDTVKAFNNNSIINDVVLAKWHQGENITYEIELEDGRTIRATPEHKILVRRNNKLMWVEVKDLRKNDNVITEDKFVKLKRIQKHTKEKVYDITTLTHNFLANGIVVHNSMATPSVAGLVTLAKQMYRQVLGKELTVDEIKRMMQALGHPKNNDAGWGYIHWGLFERWLSTEYSIEI
jgi:subtilisin family serine protease